MPDSTLKSPFMTDKKILTILRWVHIIMGLVLFSYVYSPFGRYVEYRIFIKAFVVPVVFLTGVWLWKFGLFKKMFRYKDEGKKHE